MRERHQGKFIIFCVIIIYFFNSYVRCTEECFVPDASIADYSTISSSTTTTTGGTELEAFEYSTKSETILRQTTFNHDREEDGQEFFVQDLEEINDLFTLSTTHKKEPADLLPRSIRFLFEKYAFEKDQSGQIVPAYKTIVQGKPQSHEVTKAEKDYEKKCREYKDAYDAYKAAKKNLKNVSTFEERDKKKENVADKLKAFLEIRIEFLRRCIGNAGKIQLLIKIVENLAKIEENYESDVKREKLLHSDLARLKSEFNHQISSVYEEIEKTYADEIIKIENRIFSSSQHASAYQYQHPVKRTKVYGFSVPPEEVEREIRAAQMFLASNSREAGILDCVKNHHSRDYVREMNTKGPISYYNYYYDIPRDSVEQAIQKRITKDFPYGPYELHLMPRGSEINSTFLINRVLYVFEKDGHLFFKIKDVSEKKIEKEPITCTAGLGEKKYDRLVTVLTSDVPFLSPQDEWFLLNFASLCGYFPDNLCVQATLRVIGQQRAMQEELQGRVKASEKPPLYISESGYHLRLMGEAPDKKALKRIKPNEIGVYYKRYQLKLMNRYMLEKGLKQIGRKTIGVFLMDDQLYCQADKKQKILVKHPQGSVSLDSENPPFPNESVYNSFVRLLQSNKCIEKNKISPSDANDLLNYLVRCGYVRDSLYCKIFKKAEVELERGINSGSMAVCYPGVSYDKLLMVLKNPLVKRGLLRTIPDSFTLWGHFTTSTSDRIIEQLETSDIDQLFAIIEARDILKSSTEVASESITHSNFVNLEKLYSILPKVMDEAVYREEVKVKSFPEVWIDIDKWEFNEAQFRWIDPETGKRPYLMKKDLKYRFVEYIDLYPHRERMLEVVQELHAKRHLHFVTPITKYNRKSLKRHQSLYVEIASLLSNHIKNLVILDVVDKKIPSALSLFKSEGYGKEGRPEKVNVSELPRKVNLSGKPSLQVGSYPVQHLTYDSFYTDSEVNRSPKYELNSFIKINLSSNRISGVIPTLSIELLELYINNNCFNSVRFLMYDLTKLQIFNASHNYIGDLKCLNWCKALQFLDLSHNLLFDNLNEENPFRKLKRLTYLNISDNAYRTVGFLTRLTNLIKLDISNNEITTLQPISVLTGLTDLRAHNNDLSGTFCKWFQDEHESEQYSLFPLRYLRHCNISGNEKLEFCPGENGLTKGVAKLFLPSLVDIRLNNFHFIY